MENNMTMGLVISSTMKNLSVKKIKEHMLMIISLNGVTLEHECTIYNLTSRICPSEELDMED
jgi:hypothetical protein